MPDLELRRFLSRVWFWVRISLTILDLIQTSDQCEDKRPGVRSSDCVDENLFVESDH